MSPALIYRFLAETSRIPVPVPAHFGEWLPVLASSRTGLSLIVSHVTAPVFCHMPRQGEEKGNMFLATLFVSEYFYQIICDKILKEGAWGFFDS